APSSSTSFSARHRRSTCGPTVRRTRSGPRACNRAGSSTGWTISTSWFPAASPRRIWSTTAGPTSSATSCSWPASSTRPAPRRAGYEIYGRGGVALSEKWKDGVSTLHGMHSRGFPNCFIVSNSQSGFTANFPHMLNEQSKHLAYIIKAAIDRQARTVEASQEAEDAWVQTIIDSAILRQKFQEECTPGYYNNEGKPSALAARNGPFGRGPIAFVRLIED